jgi:23S rRNA (adenine2503-C2)-methyltransferase
MDTMDSLPALSTMPAEALAALVASTGAPSFRGRQLEQALWQPFVASLADVRQLPSSLRAELDRRTRFSTVRVVAETIADGGLTLKLLGELDDGLSVETVAMETPATGVSRRRSTVCVSSQVGCAIGCPFCATGQMGLRRSCSAAEIVDQVRVAGNALHRRGLGPVTHVVFMGMGEPLANTDSVIEALWVLSRRAGISPRRITVSTSGVAPNIRRLAAEAPPARLAISLHAATDSLRDRLVPLNRRHPLQEVVAAGRDYAERTGRRLTLEWCLIGGVNDSTEQARLLAELARDARAHVNLIPMNRIDGSPWGPPDAAASRAFLETLRGVTVTVRDTRGNEADAACGQLRAALDARRRLRPDGTLGPPRSVIPV